jgi:hypothetical protein
MKEEKKKRTQRVLFKPAHTATCNVIASSMAAAIIRARDIAYTSFIRQLDERTRYSEGETLRSLRHMSALDDDRVHVQRAVRNVNLLDIVYFIKHHSVATEGDVRTRLVSNVGFVRCAL